MAANDRQLSQGGARVPKESREVWAAKHDTLISHDGTCIDLHGDKNWSGPKHLAETELTKVTDALVVSLVHRNVTSINLALCKSLTDESIKAIAKGCAGLKELIVCGIENLTDESIKAIAKGCPELKVLNVWGIENLTDESIMVLATGCPELKELNMEFVIKLTDKSIKAIAKGCPELKELSVWGIENLTDESIKAIANSCPELKELDASWIKNLTDESIKAIAKGCPRLKELSVWGIENLTDESIKAIAEGCPELKELNVCNIKKLTDESVKTIAKGCPELKELSVWGIENLTDESIKAIAKGCNKLKELDVSWTKNLTDESIKAIAKGCPELKELYVVSVENLTDESIMAIAKGCPELEELNVSYILITDESIKAIAEGCPQLKRLNVSGCRLGDSWMKAICEGCPGLEVLVATRCGLGLISEDIGHRLPHLRSLSIVSNSVSKLPPSICELKDLQELSVEGNPLQSPPYEIAAHGLDAIERYFEDFEKGCIVSKLFKVVLVGDGGAGKTSVRNALAGRPKPRQEDRTIHLDIEKITLTDDLDINVYDCGGQDEYLATQLPYLTGMALYMVVVEAQYATDEFEDTIEDKLHRFLVVLQNRVPGAVVLPIVTKVDTVKDPERRCHWLESKIDKWLQDTRRAVCVNLARSGSQIPQELAASVADDMRHTGNNDQYNFIPLRVQSPALAVSVADTGDVESVRHSVKAVRDCINAIAQHDPPLLRGVGQRIPSTYVAVLKLFGAIAVHGDNDLALAALRDGTAQALGETLELSPGGMYRPKDELEKIWNTYRDDPNVNIEDDVFDEATQLWEAQGLIFVDAGLVILQPEFITTIVKPLVDHRHNDEKEYEHFEDVAAQFIESPGPWDNDSYNELIDALYIFRATAEFDTSDESLFLSFLWRDTGLDKSHYGQVLQMLAKSGVILKVERDASERRTVAVVPFRLPRNPDETKLGKFWTTSLPLKERELKLRFEPRSGFPTGLAERFATDVHGSGTSLYSWRHGVVIKDSAGYSALAERRENMLHFSVRFEPHSSKDAAWKALCDAQQMLHAQRENRFPGLLYKERIICEECCRKRCRQVSSEKFDAKRSRHVFRACGHPFDLERQMP